MHVCLDMNASPKEMPNNGKREKNQTASATGFPVYTGTSGADGPGLEPAHRGII